MINYVNFDQLKELPSMRLRKSDIYADKAIEFMSKISLSEKGILKNSKNYALLLGNIAKALYYEEKDKKARIQEFAETLGIDPKYIAGDINDFLESSDSIQIYADDFVYSASLENKNLSSIEIIGGDAHLAALKDLSRIANLRCVLGNIQVNHSEEEVRELLPNLEYVGGSIVDLSGQTLYQKRL